MKYVKTFQSISSKTPGWVGISLVFLVLQPSLRAQTVNHWFSDTEWGQPMTIFGAATQEVWVHVEAVSPTFFSESVLFDFRWIRPDGTREQQLGTEIAFKRRRDAGLITGMSAVIVLEGYDRSPGDWKVEVYQSGICPPDCTVDALLSEASFTLGGTLPLQVVATLGQAFAGPLGSDTAFTQVNVTNRDPDQLECEVELSFDRGSEPGPAVEINGSIALGNAVVDTIPPGGAASYAITSDDLAIGIVKLSTRAPCEASSLSMSGSYTLSNETVNEVFSIVANIQGTWLQDGACRVLTGYLGMDSHGFEQNTGMATASVFGSPAPEGTELNLFTFSADGQPLEIPDFEPVLPVSGAHTALFPFDSALGLDALVTIIACLDVPGESEPDFTLDLTLVGVKQKGGGLQFVSQGFVSLFQIGDPVAWQLTLP